MSSEVTVHTHQNMTDQVSDSDVETAMIEIYILSTLRTNVDHCIGTRIFQWKNLLFVYEKIKMLSLTQDICIIRVNKNLFLLM